MNGPIFDSTSTSGEGKLMDLKENIDVGGEDASDNEPLSNAGQFSQMDRVQLALRNQLQKTHDRVSRELHEQQEIRREVKNEREDFGVQLYGTQQQLSHLQTNLESVNEQYMKLHDEIKKEEIKVCQKKKENEKRKKKVDDIKENVSRRKVELDAVLETFRQAKKFNREVKTEKEVTRRVAFKAKENVHDLEKEKNEQDSYIDSLNEKIRRIEADIDLSHAKLCTQRGQTGAAKKILSETNVQLEFLAKEKKLLVQKWNSSVLALNRRDITLTSVAKELREAEGVTKDNELDLIGLNREIKQTDIHIEGLILSRNRLENEAKFTENNVIKIDSEQESIAKHFEIVQKSITSTHEEEKKLERNISKIKSQIASITHKTEMMIQERQTLEEEIGTQEGFHATMSTSTVNLVKEEKIMNRKVHKNDIQVAALQNELARLEIDTLSTQAHNLQLKQQMNHEITEIASNDELCIEYELKIRRRRDEIEKKMSLVDHLNRKYNQIIEGIEEPEPLGPLESTIKILKNDVVKDKNEVQKLQEEWVKNQGCFIKTISTINTTQSKNREVNAKINILKQKKLRLVQEIHTNESNVKVTESSMENMHKDISRLNELIGRRSQSKTELSYENSIKEKEYTNELREAKTESHQIKEKIAEVQQEKNIILGNILQVESELLDWERKIKLEKETQEVLNSNEHGSETRGMEKEIHRMKQRLESMKSEQEKFIREMELAIIKREDIAVKYQNKKKVRGVSDKSNSITTHEMKEKRLNLSDKMKIVKGHIPQYSEKLEVLKNKIKEVQEYLLLAEEELVVSKTKEETLQSDINICLFKKQRMLAKNDIHQDIKKRYMDMNEEIISYPDSEDKIESIVNVSLQRIQKIVLGLQMKYSDFKEVFERVNILASDINSEVSS